MPTRFAYSIALYVVFTAVIGLFMFIMHHTFHYRYSQPEMVNVLIVFEAAAAAVFAWIIRAKNLYSYLGFAPLRQTDFRYAGAVLVLPLVFLIVLAFGMKEQSQLLADRAGLIATITITMMLVGFNEEVLFRGFILNSAREFLPLWAAILLSATLFSLLHAVNVFGGVPIKSSCFQLFHTFWAGIFYALIYLAARNLWVPVFLHFVWDLFAFTAPMFLSETLQAVVSLSGMVFEAAVIVLLGIRLLRNKPART